MVTWPSPDSVITQADFAEVLGCSQQNISQLIADGVLPRDGTFRVWLQCYIARLREQAAGRMGEGGELDLVQERAALAREQRGMYEIKNAVARGEYAPISLLAEVLAAASQAVVDRFEQLPGRLKKVCPDLPEAARTEIEAVHTSARNEWIRATASLTAKAVGAADDDADDLFDDRAVFTDQAIDRLDASA